jgi:hypothetical protein
MNDDEQLARLSRDTEGVSPRAGFVDVVMRAVLAEELGWWSGLPRVAVRVLPALALAAVLAAVWAYRSTRDLDEAFSSSEGSVEIEW